MDPREEFVLRGNTTVRTISGKSFTLFELVGKSNIIQGYVINSETNETYITPLKIKVARFSENGCFFGLDAIKAIEFKSENSEIAIAVEKTQIKIIDGKTYIDKKHIRTLSKEDISVKYITESRVYYKATFEFIEDISHTKGDDIYIYLNENFLIRKWFVCS